jgi:hypothetical protein
MSTELADMGSNLAVRPVTRRDSFVILGATNHYRIVNGRSYRDFVVRMADGQRRIIARPVAA